MKMKNEATATKSQMTEQSPETLVSAAEQLLLGAVTFSEAEGAARAGVAAMEAEAIAILFPAQYQAVEDAVLRDWSLFTATLAGTESITASLVRFHQDAVDSYPALAAVARGPRGTTLLRERAKILATPRMGESLSVATARAEGRTFGRFRSEIAAQLRSRGLCLPESEHIAVTVPELLARLAAAAARQVEHARAESERLEAERLAAEEAAEAERRAAQDAQWAPALALESLDQRFERERLARWFDTHQQFTFNVEGEKIDGLEIARRLRAGDAFGPYVRSQNTGVGPSRNAR